jgi:hypothetical protein
LSKSPWPQGRGPSPTLRTGASTRATVAWPIGIFTVSKVRSRIDNGSDAGRDKIGIRVGKVVNKYKVGKHFALTIQDGGFEFQRFEQQIAAEAALDGLSAEAVRSYNAPTEVERAFRSMKTIDLHIRPIHRHLEGRVRAHIFLCVLAHTRPLKDAELSTIARSTCEIRVGQRSGPTFQMTTTPNPLHVRKILVF